MTDRPDRDDDYSPDALARDADQAEQEKTPRELLIEQLAARLTGHPLDLAHALDAAAAITLAHVAVDELDPLLPAELRR